MLLLLVCAWNGSSAAPEDLNVEQLSETDPLASAHVSVLSCSTVEPPNLNLIISCLHATCPLFKHGDN